MISGVQATTEASRGVAETRCATELLAWSISSPGDLAGGGRRDSDGPDGSSTWPRGYSAGGSGAVDRRALQQISSYPRPLPS